MIEFLQGSPRRPRTGTEYSEDLRREFARSESAASQRRRSRSVKLLGAVVISKECNKPAEPHGQVFKRAGNGPPGSHTLTIEFSTIGMVHRLPIGASTITPESASETMKEALPVRCS